MMAANTTNQSEKKDLSKKQTKALERVSLVSSEPWLKPSLSELQVKDSEGLSSSCQVWSSSSAAKPDLKLMQSLSECVQLLQTLSEEVNNISQVKQGSKKAAPAGGSSELDSMESSRSLILKWAAELEQNMVQKKTKPTNEKKKRRETLGRKEKTDEDKLNERLQQWAVELRDIKEANGVSDAELKKLLYPRGSIKSRLATLLPLLEFVTWSLLAEDTEESVSMMWLTTKQKAWRTASRIPKYIPNSVWQWIQSAAVSVRFDISSCHPWLVVSPDRLQVHEEASCSPAPSNSSSLPKWPLVLGDTVITAGRHYWEVEVEVEVSVSPEGSWRIGVMSQSAPKKKNSTLSPKGGFWTLRKASSLWACTDTPTNLQMASVPQRVGVYVDMEEGQVSFYDVDQRVHVYTFSDTFKHGLIPVFGWLDGDTLLRIRPADLSVTAQGNHT
ncbi:E3 ubiquitin-protein ligase TRIM39-like isoform X1 [Notolabrus celidotus]|uniref:E3 ubiquitin-protein ligase TRIM39-like isoform X1 n=1 Tax=Notolabrus celidotus TaxID=1203425 RepID=UPI00148FF062|nr:E3 ubiquitin-protein ligase TRIM39-like isoform X1 [Notolabrus celidotus]